VSKRGGFLREKQINSSCKICKLLQVDISFVHTIVLHGHNLSPSQSTSSLQLPFLLILLLHGQMGKNQVTEVTEYQKLSFPIKISQKN
jgi:hypothetical protein